MLFRSIVFDECHEYANNADARAFKNAQTPYMLGLSATPDENANGFDPIHWWNIGPVLVAEELPGYEVTSNEFTAVVHRIMYYGPSEYTRIIKNEKTDLTNTSETINMICSDGARNRLVVKCVMDCLKQGLYVYVFADRRDPLETIRTMLFEATGSEDLSAIVTDENEFIRLVGGATMQDIEHAEIKSRVILSTYQYGATGRSIIKMNAIVFLGPRKSRMKQTVGRILRLGSDKTIVRQIYDIVDMKLTLKNQWSSRLKYYRSKSFKITEVKYDANWELGADKEDDGTPLIKQSKNKLYSQLSKGKLDSQGQLSKGQLSKGKPVKQPSSPIIKPIDYSSVSDSIFAKLRGK